MTSRQLLNIHGTVSLCSAAAIPSQSLYVAMFLHHSTKGLPACSHPPDRNFKYKHIFQSRCYQMFYIAAEMSLCNRPMIATLEY
jgi:hypothetical protein